MLPEPTDQQLLDAHVRHQSPDAFRILVERQAPWVFAAAFRQLHDQHLAEDAAQIVFILLHRRSHLMQSPRKLSGWLFNAVQFTVKNMRREKRRRDWRERRIAAQLPSVSLDTAKTTELHDQLDAAVAKLSAADRSAILLRFYQELPFDQIAAALCISEPAARKRVTRAVNTLRKHLGVPADMFSASSLILAAAHGLSQVPPTLAPTITASSTAALPAGAVATLKGVTTLMALAKLQTAALIAAVAALVLIPASMAIYHHLAPAQTIPTAADPSLPASPDPSDYLTWYSLQPGEAIKLVTDAPPAARAAFLADGDPTRRSPPEGKFITILWRQNHPYLWGYGDTVPLLDILEVYLHIYPQTLNIHLPLPPNDPKEFINLAHTVVLPSLQGDLLINADATPEQYRASLESLLAHSLGRPIAVTFRDVTEKALVLRGSWQYTPNSPHAPAQIRGMPVLEIYGTALDKNMNQGIIAHGDKNYFAGYLGNWLNHPVVIECDNFPSAVSAHYNTDAINAPQSHDKTLVLSHLTEQTGLTATEEPRSIRHLFIEETPATPSPRPN